MNYRFDEEPNIAIFCDFENVAIGVREANFEEFDINFVLERLLDKGKIVVKKAYADWDRYKSARRSMHEAAFELIEIPHIKISGKNSADIRMVVDALDLCYTKSHVNIFVIISGDSDFSPLVSKLKENNKKVIALGVKKSSSDLLIVNCDEFIYYDDIVRDHRAEEKKHNKRRGKGGGLREHGKTPTSLSSKLPPKKSSESGRHEPKKDGSVVEATSSNGPDLENDSSADVSHLHEQALEMVLDTVEALFREREDNLWGSMVKQTLKRKKPNFAESFYGYRTFNQLLEDAQHQGLLELQKDEKSGGYLIIAFGPNA